MPFSTLDYTCSRLPKGYNNPSTIGEHLLKIRYDRKLTQKTLAEILGVSQPMVCSWESERCKPVGEHMKNVLEFIYDIKGAT